MFYLWGDWLHNQVLPKGPQAIGSRPAGPRVSEGTVKKRIRRGRGGFTSETEWAAWLESIKNFWNSSKNQKGLASVLFSPESGDSRPFLKVRLLDLEFCGLLDSGATISLLGNNSHRRLMELGYSLQPLEKIVEAANGGNMKVTGVMNLPITFQDKTRVLSLYVVPGATNEVIFGVDFWKSFGIAPEIFDWSVTSAGKPKSFLNSLSDSPIHTILSYQTLTTSQKALADAMIDRFKQISSEVVGLGRTTLMKHTIDTGDAAPVRTKQYQLSPEKREALQVELDKMLKLGVVAPSESPWNNPVLLVPKAEGEWRFCLDSRKLNAVSKGDAYAVPYIPQILDSLKEARFLSSIDLASSFWQIPLDESSKEKTSFSVPGRGLFRFEVVPFGLCGASSRQQRLMDLLFNTGFADDIIDGMVYVYVDDIVVVSSSLESHLTLLDRVLGKLKYANLTVNFKKCKFFRSSLKYLGFVVDEMGLRTDPDKVRAILDFPVPESAKQVKMFLGTASWYRRFIRDFASIAAPLNALTSTAKKAPKFIWTEEANRAFMKLKESLVSAPVLACPDFDRPFIVHCDASSFGLGGMLTQKFDDAEHPIAYASRSLSKAERNYSATEREALAVIFAIEKFQAYLGSRHFTVVTDHASLKWFMKLENPTGRLVRWGCRLSQFDFHIEHRKGSENVVPDALSRLLKVEVLGNVTDTLVPDTWYDNILEGLKSHPNNYPNYRMENDKILRFSKAKYTLSEEFEWKEVVRSDQKEAIMAANHGDPTAAHLGTFKTHRRISLHYYWPKMFKDIKEFVERCDVCAAYKSSNRTIPGLMGKPKVCHRPFQVLSVDLVGPLPRSRAGHIFLLVVTCCFSKYTILFPLRRATSALVAGALERGVFLTHGVPETVIADNGVQFTGSEFRKLLENYKVPKTHFTPRYAPQVNLVERYNKTVMTAVSAYVKEDHRSWDVNIPKIQFAINSAVNESTQFSPFFLVHGREPVVDGSLYRSGEGDYEPGMPREEYAGDLGLLRSIFDQVRQHMLKAHRTNAKFYNLRRRDASVKVGDIVWKKTYPLSDAAKFKAAKLCPKYEKCRVKEILSPLVVELENMQGKTIGSWHIKDLKI